MWSQHRRLDHQREKNDGERDEDDLIARREMIEARRRNMMGGSEADVGR
jgi:hypothetical protein